MDDNYCPFEKAILSTECACEKSERFIVGERTGVLCTSDIAHRNCRILLELLQERSRFTLKQTDSREALTFGKGLKVMVGGLIGVQCLFEQSRQGTRPVVSNIHELVMQAQEAYGSLTALPYQEVVKSVAAYQRRRRRGVPRT
jgi:hypothetical protein